MPDRLLSDMSKFDSWQGDQSIGVTMLNEFNNTARYLCLSQDIDIIKAHGYRLLNGTNNDAPIYAVWFFDCTYTDSSVGLDNLENKQHLLLNRDHLAAMCLIKDSKARQEYAKFYKLGIYHPSYNIE